jgi:small subunit ribosomal protein S7
MPRRPIIVKRTIPGDPKFRDRTVNRLILKVMKQGKRTTAEGIVYGSFDIIAERIKDDPVKVFKRALENVKPVVETKARRVGGANYQVPMEVRPTRREALGLSWIILYAAGRPGHSMRERLADELIDAYHGRGGAMKKRDDVHKMAEANKAFAHYRW